jgi:chemotaxis protein MotB
MEVRMLGRFNARLVRTTALAALAASAALFAGGCNQQKAKESEALQTQVATLQQDNDALRTQLQQSEAQRNETSRQLAEAMAAKQAMQQQPPAPPSGGTGGTADRPERVERDVVISVAGDVAFASGQDTLTAAGRRELDGIARTLNSRYAGHRLRIEGYTDSDPLVKTRAKWGTNQALSLARARAVEKYLESRGVSGARMDSVGRGSANPKSTKAASRRVEIHVLGK